MIHIPKHIQDLKSYHPGKPVEEWARELGLSETAVLWNNENNLGIPPQAKAAMESGIESLNLYPDALCEELRGALATQTGRDLAEITVGNGSEELLMNINKAFLNPGDELLTSEGTFVAVYIWAHAANLNVKKVPLTADYGFDLNALKASVSDETKLIYIANPNNPTGTALSENALRDFIESVSSDKLIIIDEAYFEYALAMDPSFPDSSKWNYENVITLRTFSKAYGLAGMRLGYGIAHEKISTAMRKVRMTFAPNSLSQLAGIGALKDHDFLKKTIALNNEAIASFNTLFESKGIRVAKTAANFVMLDLESEEKAVWAVEEMRNRGVFIRHIKAFGLPTCVRINTGTPRENELLKKIVEEIF